MVIVVFRSRVRAENMDEFDRIGRSRFYEEYTSFVLDSPRESRFNT